jgi:hypothetical protein
MTVEDDPMVSLFAEVIPIRGKKIARRNARKTAYKQVSPGDVEQLFEFWRTTLNKKALLSDERRAILAWGILNYGMETCEMAIKGCSISDWHMGRNPNNVRYDSVELIFRNAEKVEWFVAKFEAAGSPKTTNGDPF